MHKYLLLTVLVFISQPSNAELTIEQCESDLPVKIPGARQILKHTWLRYGDESWGMPYTDQHTYFGGRAHLYSPDPFLIKGPKHLRCLSIEGLENPKASARAACLARKISIPGALTDLVSGWTAHWDYHALKRNCLSLVRFVAECAGGKIPLLPNAGVGGKVDWEKLFFVNQVSISLQALQARVRQMGTHWADWEDLTQTAQFRMKLGEKIILRQSEAFQSRLIEWKTSLTAKTPRAAYQDLLQLVRSFVLEGEPETGMALPAAEICHFALQDC